MGRLIEWNSEHTHGRLIKEDGYTRLAEYEDTGLTPEEIHNLKAIKDMQADTIKTFATELCKEKKKADYWEREAKKWCAKLGEIRMLAGGD